MVIGPATRVSEKTMASSKAGKIGVTIARVRAEG